MITKHVYVAPITIHNTIAATRNAQGRCQFSIGWELGPDGGRIKDFHCCQAIWQHMEQR